MKDYVYVKAFDQADIDHTFYLHLDGAERLPRLLGTGRNAVVFLATTTHLRETAANAYHAIKFLRDDIDRQYARASARRFFEEADKAKRFRRVQETFVRYFGLGAVDAPEQADEQNQARNFWWRQQLHGYDKRLRNDDAENNKDVEAIRRHYNLQGPFYVLDLCQGTLYDLLDKNVAWNKLPAYSIADFHDSLQFQASKVNAHIEEIHREYMNYSPFERSGYDILNGFKNDLVSNRIRNRAVLQLFSQVADTVAQLHNNRDSADTRSMRQAEPLAHRDLKPGNIFFQHDAGLDGLKHIKVQLSDLGYVTNAEQIISGDFTLQAGHRGVDYQAPGSQYYRAPEQAELPIEVRVDIDAQQPDGRSPQQVRVRGSKIDRIDVHDWLSLSDIFTDEERSLDANRGLFKIKTVTLHNDAHGGYYLLTLDKPIETSLREDIQAQIIRSTGFHTDGFSLGAILYDLVSGGKNPQSFYTYCIVSLTSQLAKNSYSVEDIVDILVPQPRSTHSNGDELTLTERHRMLPALLNEDTDLDNLFDHLQKIAFSHAADQQRPALNYRDRLGLLKTVVDAKDIDHLVELLVKLPLYQRTPVPASNGEAPEDVKRSLAQRLKNYRFRTFDQVNNLLRDKRGVSLPRDILRIIVACMIRDVAGSYYVSDAENGYNSDVNFKAAARIREHVEQLLGGAQYSLPETGFPEPLEANLLFKLRSLAQP